MLAEETDISTTADLFGVSLRTLRYYEEIGLLKPVRNGGVRRYTANDRVRLQLITVGKRIGLSLSAIQTVIVARTGSELHAAHDAEDLQSIVKLLTKEKRQQQLDLLLRQKADLEKLIDGLRQSIEEG